MLRYYLPISAMLGVIRLWGIGISFNIVFE